MLLRNGKIAGRFIPRLRLLRYCRRLTLPSWLGVIWPTSSATAELSPTTSMLAHTDCTFSTSTDTWKRDNQRHRGVGVHFTIRKARFGVHKYLTRSLVGSSMLWDVALTLSGEAAPSCS